MSKEPGGKSQRGKGKPKPSHAHPLLSAEEQGLMDLFREYRMTPGKMLCLASADLDTFRRELTQLTAKGMLTAERFRGGYSLTEIGFTAMKQRA